MSWLIAVPLFFASWFFFVVLGAGPKAIEKERKGAPEDQRHGVSIAPGFPVFPIVAWALWCSASPFVAKIVVWLHIALLVFSCEMIIYCIIQLRRPHADGFEAIDDDGSNAA